MHQARQAVSQAATGPLHLITSPCMYPSSPHLHINHRRSAPTSSSRPHHSPRAPTTAPPVHHPTSILSQAQPPLAPFSHQPPSTAHQPHQHPTHTRESSLRSLTSSESMIPEPAENPMNSITQYDEFFVIFLRKSGKKAQVFLTVHSS